MKTVLLLTGFMLAHIHFAEAQQTLQIPRVGYVSASGNPTIPESRFRIDSEGSE